MDLSIIIPALNEADTIGALVRNLAEQEDVRFEVILCDGGSTDGTGDRFLEAARDSTIPARVIVTGKGRGRQMNEGAGLARGDLLLFLHADSLFSDRKALRKGLDALAAAMGHVGHERVAGRFALRFRRENDKPSLFYYYHECKARLNRGECTHGDQGFLLDRLFFSSAGTFEESIPVLEDTRFAEAVRRTGTWILLPAEIHTSARRFEMEGQAGRETVNAILMTLSAAGRDDFLSRMPRIYAGQDQVQGLKLYPFFSGIRDLLGALPSGERTSFWRACGSYAAANLWQAAFLLDVRRNFRLGVPPGEGRYRRLECFDRLFCPITKTRGVKVCAALLVFLWFHAVLAYGRVREKT